MENASIPVAGLPKSVDLGWDIFMRTGIVPTAKSRDAVTGAPKALFNSTVTNVGEAATNSKSTLLSLTGESVVTPGKVDHNTLFVVDVATVPVAV